ncbi:MAG: 23S rRNA (uracil(1939)-C(5))-methyltransferase RlmD [Lachnospiraceae bacterium]|nr:23S rRNA (uracil(1939)-C(5))-methyltransferase RlmD [Lachnospiraceae bacterium]
MKKGTEYTGYTTRTDFPNKGRVLITTEDGPQTVTVKDALEGQTIRLAITKAKKGRAEGRLLEVITPSEAENTEKDCPHFGQCGGCSLRTLPYEAQLSLKEKQVRMLLDNALGETCPAFVFEGIKKSPCQNAYRNKMEFSFGDEYKDGPLSLGLHKKGSFYDIITVNGCQIVHEDFRRILVCVLAYFKERGTSYYHKQTHQGSLRHLLVRRAVKTGDILIDLVTTSQEILPLEGLTAALTKLSLTGTIAGILHSVNDSPADTVQADSTEILYGKDYFYEELLGLTFRISPFSFFQTNSLGAEVLYDTVRSYAGETNGRLIFDLYSGTGTIAQLLAPVAKKVIGVELIEEAVLAARENAALNHLNNCEFIAGDVLKVIDTIEDKPDLIILDPPRDGIHPKALPKIIAYGVEHIVYVSCKPTSLARDLEVFLANGYEAVRGCAVDMFPGTNHVETVVLLRKNQTPKESSECSA